MKDLCTDQASDVYINDIYYHALESDARVIVLYGGADAGKSYFIGGQYIPISMAKEPYLRGVSIRKTGATNHDSTFQEIKDGIESMDLESYFNVKESRGNEVIEYGDNKMLFKGLDKVSKLKSVKGLNMIWVEEAEEITEMEFDNLLLRLRGGGHERIILTFNPVDEDHFSNAKFNKQDRKIIERDEDGNPKVWTFTTSGIIDGEKVSYDTLVIKAIYKDNDFISPQRKLALETLKDTNPKLYEVLVRGNYGRMGEKILTNWIIKDLSDVIDTFDNIRYGLDWGYFPDPFRFLKTHIDVKRKKIYIFKELNENEKTNDYTAKQVIELLHKSSARVVCDSSEPKSIAEYVNYGVYAHKAIKGPGSIEHGLKFLQDWEIIVDPSCKHTIKDLKYYSRKVDRYGNTLKDPEDAWNHSPDVIRYIMEEFDGARRKMTAR